MEQELNVVQDQVAQEVAPEVSTPEVSAPQPSEQEERYQKRNFRELREEAERVARERDEYQQKVRLYEAQLAQQQKNQQSQDHRSNINDDDLIDYKTLKNELQSVRQELNEYRSVSSSSAAESRLRSDFPDIEHVVTAENIQKLREREPHLAATIANGRDVYTSGAAAYRAIVGLGLVETLQRDYTAEKKLATSNAQRPRPASTAGNANNSGESPLARGNMYAPTMTPEQKEQKYRQLREILDRR